MRARGGNGRSPSTRTTSTTTTPIAARGCFQVSNVGFAATHRTPPSQCSSSSLDDDDEMPKHGKPKPKSDDMRPIAPLPMPMPPTVPPPPPSAAVAVAVADVVLCFVCRCESPNGRSAHDAKVRIVRRCE